MTYFKDTPGNNFNSKSTSPVRGKKRKIPAGKRILREDDESRLVVALKDLCDLEYQLENDKIALSLRTDFNLIDAFGIFDKNKNGYVIN